MFSQHTFTSRIVAQEQVYSGIKKHNMYFIFQFLVYFYHCFLFHTGCARAGRENFVIPAELEPLAASTAGTLQSFHHQNAGRQGAPPRVILTNMRGVARPSGAQLRRDEAVVTRRQQLGRRRKRQLMLATSMLQTLELCVRGGHPMSPRRRSATIITLRVTLFTGAGVARASVAVVVQIRIRSRRETSTLFPF